MLSAKRIIVLIIILCIWQALWQTNNNLALAGTAQIYSPAGLPRSSNQDYSIPDTTITPQTFPTPPIPLQTNIQSLSGMPFKEDLTTNSIKSATPTNQNNATAPSGRVETFFQCMPNEKELSSTDKNKPNNINVGKLIWHTLDNIGVPLPTSKADDLAPELGKTYAIPAQHSSSSNYIQPIHQKIPDSELGVSDIPEKDDAKLH